MYFPTLFFCVKLYAFFIWWYRLYSDRADRKILSSLVVKVEAPAWYYFRDKRSNQQSTDIQILEQRPTAGHIAGMDVIANASEHDDSVIDDRIGQVCSSYGNDRGKSSSRKKYQK
jgi:hypothetical protein